MVLMIRWQVCEFAICPIEASAIVSFCPLGDHTGFTKGSTTYILAHGHSDISPSALQHINGAGHLGHLNLHLAEVLLGGGNASREEQTEGEELQR